MIAPDYQGLVDVELKLLIGENGLVEQVDIVGATNSVVGQRIAASAQNWIFVPYVKDGVAQPATTNVTLRIPVIKSQ